MNFGIISKIFKLQTSAWSQKSQFRATCSIISWICFKCLGQICFLVGFLSKWKILSWSLCIQLLVLICLSLISITSERIELQNQAWTQKMRLSELYPNMISVNFDLSFFNRSYNEICMWCFPRFYKWHYGRPDGVSIDRWTDLRTDALCEVLGHVWIYVFTTWKSSLVSISFSNKTLIHRKCKRVRHLYIQ